MALTQVDAATQVSHLPWLDVRKNGAKGDGSTNDSAAIRAAEAALEAVGGGTLFFSGSAGTAPAVYLVSGTSLSIGADNITWRGSGPDQSIIKSADSANFTSQLLLISGRKNVVIDSLGFHGNYRNQASGLGIGIFITHSFACTVRNCKFTYWGYPTAPAASGGINSAGISVSTSPRTTIEKCDFLGNAGYDINLTSDANGDLGTYSWGCRIIGTRHGTPVFSQANTNTNWWDTQGGGLAGCIIAGNCPGLVVSGVQVWGAGRFSDTFAKGTPIRLTYCDHCEVVNNFVDGMIVGYGTVSVTNGSPNVTGVPGSGGPTALFNTASGTNGDINQWIQFEGDAGLYRISTVSSGTAIVLSSNVGRTTASGLRYRIPMGGDNIGVVSCINAKIANNTSIYAGDMGISAGEQSTNVRMDGVSITGNNVVLSRVCGLIIYGEAKYWTITGNTFGNNHQCGSQVPTAGYRGAIGMDPIDNTRTQSAIVIDGNAMFDDASTPTAPLTVGSVSKANPAVFTVTAHGLITGEAINISGATGDWAAMNASGIPVIVTGTNTFTIAVNSSAFTGSFNGTVTANQPWQRVALDMNTSPATISSCKWGVNTDNRVTSNVVLTGGTNGFTSATLS